MNQHRQKIEWQISQKAVSYQDSITLMEQRLNGIISGQKPEMIWLTEHPPIYTGGISARESDLLRNEATNNIPVYQTNRGGKYTYHGPGIRIIYVMLDLKKCFAPEQQDVARFVTLLEEWVIAVLAHFSIKGFIRPGRVGIWVIHPDGSEKKIAAIGIKLKKWVSYHGIAININPDLAAFDGIIPCGISEFGVTSFADIGKNIDFSKLDLIIRQEFYRIFSNYTK